MRRISITGIVVAHVATTAIVIVATVGVFFVFSRSAFALGVTTPEFAEALAAIGLSSRYLLACLAIAVGSTVVGGYIVGRFGANAPYLNVLTYVVTGLAIGAALAPWQPDNLPSWYTHSALASYFPSALLGGFLAKWPARRTPADGTHLEETVAAWPGDQPEPVPSPSLFLPGSLEDGHLQERSRLRRSVATLLWFFPLSYYVDFLLGGLVGSMAGSSATSMAEAATVGRDASVAFFDQYGLVVLACQAGVTLALSLRGTLPGTSRYRCTHL